MLSFQVYSLCVVMLAGVATGFLYDGVRVTQSYLSRRSWVRHALDLAFWVIAGVVLGIGLFIANWGDPRGYLALGAVVGTAIYLYLARPVALRLLELFGRLIYRLILIFLWPIRRLIAALLRFIRQLWCPERPPAAPPQ